MAYWGGLLFCDASDGRRKAGRSQPGFSIHPRLDMRAAKLAFD
jgi:hypothetical protein